MKLLLTLVLISYALAGITFSSVVNTADATKCDVTSTLASISNGLGAADKYSPNAVFACAGKRTACAATDEGYLSVAKSAADGASNFKVGTCTCSGVKWASDTTATAGTAGTCTVTTEGGGSTEATGWALKCVATTVKGLGTNYTTAGHDAILTTWYDSSTTIDADPGYTNAGDQKNSAEVNWSTTCTEPATTTTTSDSSTLLLGAGAVLGALSFF